MQIDQQFYIRIMNNSKSFIKLTFLNRDVKYYMIQNDKISFIIDYWHINMPSTSTHEWALPFNGDKHAGSLYIDEWYSVCL